MLCSFPESNWPGHHLAPRAAGPHAAGSPGGLDFAPNLSLDCLLLCPWLVPTARFAP